MTSVSQDRKASYKAGPPSTRSRALSQEARRKKALEEQKRRRAERFDSTRQLDLFADMNLGQSDDEEIDEPVREGITQYAPMLSNASPVDSTSFSPATSSLPFVAGGISNDSDVVTVLPTSFGKKKGKSRRKSKAQTSSKPQAQSTKPSKWADKCMYAELLEMTEDTEMSEFGTGRGDGIPDDLETGWVAVAPVPVGKRCLAITHAASGIAGVVPNTTLRSRVLGKSLMAPFPSALPPHTIIDCILDDNWRTNGVLHILDVLKWKGQDIADCETPFRLWWRDTRLSELPALPPPNVLASLDTSQPSTSNYQFQYPTTLIPIPYHINFTFAHVAFELIPLTRSARQIPISIPLLQQPELQDEEGPSVQLRRQMTMVDSDGLLLYMAHASYEPGTSPLSLWVPIRSYTGERTNEDESIVAPNIPVEGPLDVFERLIKRRLTILSSDTPMDML